MITARNALPPTQAMFSGLCEPCLKCARKAERYNQGLVFGGVEGVEFRGFVRQCLRGFVSQRASARLYTKLNIQVFLKCVCERAGGG